MEGTSLRKTTMLCLSENYISKNNKCLDKERKANFLIFDFLNIISVSAHYLSEKDMIIYVPLCNVSRTGD